MNAESKLHPYDAAAELVTTTESTGAPPNPDAERIMLLARIVSLRQEQAALSDADEWAPDEGPLHARYEETVQHEREAAVRLFHLGAPETLAGGRLAARLALDAESSRHRHYGVLRCGYFGEWLVLAALQGVTGIREQIGAGESLRSWLDAEAEEDAPTRALAEAQP